MFYFVIYWGESDIKLDKLIDYPDCLLSNLYFLHVCKCLNVEESKQNRLTQEE